jgi:heme oxygenase
LPAEPDPSLPGLHQALRQATRAPHERLHGHPGFLAVQKGTIEVDTYRALLARLYGFHLPFEAAAGIGPDRSHRLRDDLVVLGFDADAIAGLPICHIPGLGNANRQLGALYVVEGSALGGLAMGKGLDRLLGPGIVEGRRFFLGRGRETAVSWNALLADLLTVQAWSSRAEIIAAAVQIFTVFEQWLNDGSTDADG